MLGNPAYPTYQVFLAIFISAMIAGLIMPLWIRFLKKDGIGQQIRADGPQSHLVKAGTPTMGGVIILLAVCLTCLIMARPTVELLLAVGAMLATGALGLFDDVTKVVQKRSLGLTPTGKMIGLTLIVLVFFIIAVNYCDVAPVIRFPGGFTIDLGVLTTTLTVGGMDIRIPWLYLVFVFLLLAGMSNAVNLTDGLDGLAGGTVMISMIVMAAICFVRHDANLAIFCAACAGGCIGFLWFNAYPAQIFMGDTGSLFLGGAIAALAFAYDMPLILLLVGFVYLCETLSDIIQVAYFKATHGKRIFKMAPLHHHFEMCGWNEKKIVAVFTAVSALMCLLAYWGVADRFSL